MKVQLRHAEYQSQCSQHKERLGRLQTTYYALKAACEKRMTDLHRIDRALEQSVNARWAPWLGHALCYLSMTDLCSQFNEVLQCICCWHSASWSHAQLSVHIG